MRMMMLALAASALAACETLPDLTGQTGGPQTLAPTSTQSAAPTATPAPPPDRQLLELERQLSATAQERGLGAALAGSIDPADGIVIRPGQAYAGAEAITAGLNETVNAGPMYWQPDRVHVSDSGDMGVTSGRYVQVVRSAEAVQGRYLIVWRRQGGGDWRILTETRIPDPARAPARRR